MRFRDVPGQPLFTLPKKKKKCHNLFDLVSEINFSPFVIRDYKDTPDCRGHTVFFFSLAFNRNLLRDRRREDQLNGGCIRKWRVNGSACAKRVIPVACTRHASPSGVCVLVCSKRVWCSPYHTTASTRAPPISVIGSRAVSAANGPAPPLADNGDCRNGPQAVPIARGSAVRTPGGQTGKHDVRGSCQKSWAARSRRAL